MPSVLPPLSAQVEIVDKDGKPTPQFCRILQRLTVSPAFSVTNGEVDFATIAAKNILANKTSADGTPTACTISDILDFIAGTPGQGDILFRGATGWKRLPAGTVGQMLRTNGPALDPSWASAGGGGGWTILSFTGAGATLWGSANTFASDQTITLSEGDKLEVSLIVDRTIANEVGLGVSPDGNLCYISRVDATNTNLNYYYLTSTGAPTILGSLVTNGDFSLTTGWTLGGGGVTISGGHVNASGASSIIQQNIGSVSGLPYSFSFDFTKSSGSSLRISTGAFNSATVYTSATLAASGTIAGSYTAQGANFNLEANAAVFTGTIDNVVVAQGLINPKNLTSYAYSGGVEIRFIVYVGASTSSNRISTAINSNDMLNSLDNHVNLIASTNKVYITLPSGDFTKIKAIQYRVNT